MIEVLGLSKNYGEVQAVDNISFKIEQGQIVGLLGPNGAGKSTTIRMLCGYLTPSAGDIKVKNLSVTDHTLEVKKLIGYLPESAPLYGEMMVYDYLLYVAEIREVPKAEVSNRLRDVARQCGLTGVMHKNINELSKGYKQRVGIAHAMIGNPEILVLDEPTSGLDPNQIIEIRNLIKELGKAKTVILSSHILSEVEATCNRVIIVNKGHIVADGNPQEIKSKYSGERLLSIEVRGVEFEVLRSTLSALPGVLSVLNGNPNQGGTACVIKSKEDDDVSPSVFDLVKNKNWQLLSFHQEAKSLEHIFHELTQ
jgi:ABC-2 type transport system ATP-binding protein